jgi:ATP-dependent Clp protease protease subunit
MAHLQIEIDCDRDNFMDPNEAKEYGLIDDVIDVPGVVAPEWVLAEPPKTKINEYWTVRKRKDIRVSAKKDRKRITRST